MERQSEAGHDFWVRRKPYRKRPPANPPRHYIAEWRIYRDISQEELAAQAGMSGPSLSQIENGYQGYSQRRLEALARVLGTDPASLLVRNPFDPEGIWSIWDRIPPPDRPRARDVLRAFAGPDQTEPERPPSPRRVRGGAR